MTTPIDIYADYVCPYCLLADHVLRDALAGRDVEVRWHPFELRPDPVPTLRVEDPYLPAIWARSVYPLAARLGVPISLPTISPQPRSTLAFEAFAHAQTQGLGAAFSIRVMEAFFQENRNIGAPEVLVALAGQVGLDPDDMRNALAERRHAADHAAALRHAVQDLGIRAVPAIFVGDQRFEGMPTPELLREAVDRARHGSGPAAPMPTGATC